MAEHREIHGIWVVITQAKKAYAHHPETSRWQGRLKALYLRHERVVEEMLRRGYVHRSPLPVEQATGDDVQSAQVDSVEEQMAMLRGRGCACQVS